MPGLRSKLPTFYSFAIKSLEAIYSQSRLEKAHRFEANTLESGIFINDGSGRFSFVQLPHIAQAFPVFSIAIKDFTNDDKPDLCLVGNSNSPQREMGNMDGGISLPGDAVVPTSDNHPAGEHAGLAIDGDSSTKYLNFDGANNTPSGLTITTGGGVVTGLGLTSANDAPDRDPATFVLSGSNDGGATLTEIASGDLPAFEARFERQEVSFNNSAAYMSYHLIFPTTAGPSTCCMQIAEIELLGQAAEAQPAPTLSVVNNGDGTVTFEGRLQAAPTVNGPWQDVDGASPLTIPADQVQQYGRAVRD